jgi:hypothetical protein
VGLLVWALTNPIGRLLARTYVVRWLVRKLMARSIRKSIAHELKELVGHDVAEDPLGRAIGKRLRKSSMRRGLDQAVEGITDRALRTLAS